MDSFKDSLKDTRASLELASGPMKDLCASSALISDPMKEHREMMASFSDSMKDFQTSLSVLSDPMKEYREMMDSFSDTTKNFQASLGLLSNPMKEHHEMMASFSDPMKELRESLSLSSGSLGDILNAITDNSSLNSIRDIALEVRPDIEVDDKGGIFLSSKHITALELQELSNKILHESSLVETSSLEESINILVSEIRSQKDPLIQKILFYFICPLILIIIGSLINPLVEHHVKTYLNSDKRALIKELKLSVSSTINNKEILSAFRYVSADTLNVRSSASVKSEIIGYLRFSSTVLVVKKEKNWTLIEWNDPDTDIQITGWVFTRYLARFR